MYHTATAAQKHFLAYDNIICDWPSLREQLLAQWSELTIDELDEAWPNRSEVARLVQSRYGIPASMIETYLSNVERRLPAL